jgi:hypothetical protein
MTAANMTVSQQPIDEQRKFFVDRDIVVADMVQVTAEEFPRYFYASAERHGFTEFAMTNGYFSFYNLKNKAATEAAIKVNFAEAVRGGAKDEQGERIKERVVLVAINSDASMDDAGRDHYAASLRVGSTVAATNGPVYAVETDEANQVVADENDRPILTKTAEPSSLPFVEAVILYDTGTACAPIEYAFQKLSEMNFVGYYKGPKYSDGSKGTSKEHQLVEYHQIGSTIVGLAPGTSDIAPAYDQTGTDHELAKAMDGDVDLDSLKFLVTKELHDYVQAQSR